MKNVGDALAILLKRIPTRTILTHSITYDNWPEDEFFKISSPYMAQYSEGEIRLLHKYLAEYSHDEDYLYMENDVDSPGLNIYRLVLRLVKSFLMLDDNKVAVHYEKLLEWRRLTIQLSEDIFTCAYLANIGLSKEQEWGSLCWEVIIGHNNLQLTRILDKGISENHFHLWASAPYFQLSWVIMMNRCGNDSVYRELFQEIDKGKQYVNYTYDTKYREVPCRILCLQAALIRAYLYSWITGRWLRIGKYYISQEEAEEILGVSCHQEWCAAYPEKRKISLSKIEKQLSKETLDRVYQRKTYERVAMLLSSPWNIDAYEQEILSGIVGLQCYGTEQEDYILQDAKGIENLWDAERLYCGERWFLYQMFYRIFRSGNAYCEQYNWFYAYLAIKESFRSELVQVNDKIGFLNFQRYSRRKNKGLPKDKADFVSRMALSNTLRNKRLRFLEARITPHDSPEKDRNCIQMLDSMLQKEEKDKCFYVFHFAKSQDNAPLEKGIPQCRHYEKRKHLRKQAEALVLFREKYPATASRVRGIDACSNEIGCRPEVFGQAFRYLRNHVKSIEGWNGLETIPQLRTTYHVGEDFLDIGDGLRAVDEAVHFLSMDCGDRLGHAIVLGIDIEKWYEKKNYRILLPIQDYIDNLAWMYGRIVEFKIDGMELLLHYLEGEFEYHFRSVYRERIPKENQDFSILTYYYSQRLRGDAPECYLGGRFKETAAFLDSYDRYAVMDIGIEKKNYRRMPEAAVLYYMYHYDYDVRRRGKRALEININKLWIRGVAELQKKMQQHVARRGIAIETNPSSNILISGFQKYDEHPIIKLYNHFLVSDKDKLTNCAQLSVSINTDDKGIFSTSLENEYAFMTCSLEQAKDENDNYLYEKTMVYEWIDKVREFGNMQSFGGGV